MKINPAQFAHGKLNTNFLNYLNTKVKRAKSSWLPTQVYLVYPIRNEHPFYTDFYIENHNRDSLVIPFNCVDIIKSNKHWMLNLIRNNHCDYCFNNNWKNQSGGICCYDSNHSVYFKEENNGLVTIKYEIKNVFDIYWNENKQSGFSRSKNLGLIKEINNLKEFENIVQRILKLKAFF